MALHTPSSRSQSFQHTFTHVTWRCTRKALHFLHHLVHNALVHEGTRAELLQHFRSKARRIQCLRTVQSPEEVVVDESLQLRTNRFGDERVQAVVNQNTCNTHGLYDFVGRTVLRPKDPAQKNAHVARHIFRAEIRQCHRNIAAPHTIFLIIKHVAG
ncbi:hypothetical protein, conserved in T. vivax [Trypanosoma vivax Y486]|uniref:Uncharacterized protein n=1 Tax=Trypanosoma vivax (strain Y486) TaxID=1055687 RepID=F9WP58_TRYVY|nr:hypothetical protein, conserved in T. vivax [Trypanosoma vivax Y486]|eukprot:CCD19332.1 hypothetical protein, conserved in T. vivax [Trypanosoma vivax Y486]